MAKRKSKVDAGEHEEAQSEATKEDQAAEVDETTELDQDEQSVEELVAYSAELASKVEEYRDKHLRTQAEFENFRRRTKTEKARLYDQSVADVISAWLPVLDNLQRAQDSISELTSDEKDAMLEGLELVKKQANEVLERFGVQEIPALGETFDPELHAAVLHIEDEEYGQGEIVEVFQAGYKRSDQVLRHSVVKVAN